MFRQTFTVIRALLTKIAMFLVGLGFVLAIAVGMLSFTELQQFWLWYELLIKASVAMIIGGITIVLNFVTWIRFERRTRKIRFLDAIFNYGVMFLVFGGGVTYLLEVFWLSNINIALIAMRCYVLGVFILIIRNKLMKLLNA